VQAPCFTVNLENKSLILPENRMEFVHARPVHAGLLAGLMLLGGGFLPQAVQAQGGASLPVTQAAARSIVIEIPAFRQAVAEAAAESEAISAFYRARDYAPIWTGAEDAARRSALLSALARAPKLGPPM
jgi:hypothetical protein